MKSTFVGLTIAVLTAGVLSGPSPALAGWVMTETSGDETLVSQGKMKSVWDNGYMILDAQTQKIHFIDDERKVQAAGTVDEVCASLTQMIDSLMAGIPDDQKEMMKQMMGGTGTRPEVVEKGSGGKVAGFETTRYEVLVDGEVYEEIWLAKDESLKKECQSLMEMLGRLTSCIAKVNFMADIPIPESSPDYLALFKKGVIVKSVEHGDEGVNTTLLSPRDVPASTFSIPSDYETVPFSSIWGEDM